MGRVEIACEADDKASSQGRRLTTTALQPVYLRSGEVGPVRVIDETERSRPH
jgi:hypothetical protein